MVSYLLRKSGGTWKSADLDQRAVRAIRELVHDGVFQIDGHKTAFRDNEFDRIVIVDFLEHIRTDREFANELYRIVKPGGELIVNVPHIKQSMLCRFRHALGETDEKHGHVRPGYTPESLARVLQGGFTLVSWKTYSKFFSEMLDSLLSFAYGRLHKKPQPISSKGTIVTAHDLTRHHRMFRLYSVTYPLLWLVAKLDRLLFWTSGYMLIAKARVNK